MPRDCRGAKLTGADLAGQDLAHADLRGARLAGAKLAGADLTRATLRGADLCGADLTGAVLTEADLTGVRADADTCWPEGFDRAAAARAGESASSAAAVPRSFEERTEDTFFEEGRLKQIPARNQRKLQVVLARLAEAFEPERRYTEREVNAILTRFNPDCATLRRMLCDYRWMARQQGIYWRLRNVEGLKAELRRVVEAER